MCPAVGSQNIKFHVCLAVKENLGSSLEHVFEVKKVAHACKPLARACYVIFELIE
jgi:hypothetical protein